MTINQDNCALVLGAGGGLGSALVSQFLSDAAITKVFAVSSQDQPFTFSVEGREPDKLVWIKKIGRAHV